MGDTRGERLERMLQGVLGVFVYLWGLCVRARWFASLDVRVVCAYARSAV